MILTGNKIVEELKVGGIKISPWQESRATTNSYDLELGSQFIRYLDDVVDPRKEPRFRQETIPASGLKLHPGEFILGESKEVVGSDEYVPIIHAKSGTARKGLFVHVTADLIDIGSHGKITFQLYSTLPVVILPGMLIAQVTFWKPIGEITRYSGKYQNSDGPIVSRTYLDYTR